MKIINAKEIQETPKTYLIYGKPGIGKTTAVKSAPGKVLHLDVDRLSGVLSGSENIDISYIDNRDTYDSWIKTINYIFDDLKGRYDYIVVDNISELERCVLSELGRKGKNQGVPSQGDYQRMQFLVLDSIRSLKNMGANLILIAWEQHEQYVDSSGQTYTMALPQINRRILNNVCGLCDCVGRLMIDEDGKRGFMLQPTNSTYAKNQIDNRIGCLQEELFDDVSTPPISKEACE